MLKGDAFQLEMFCERQRHFNVNLFSCKRIIVRPILLFKFFFGMCLCKIFLIDVFTKKELWGFSHNETVDAEKEDAY